MMTREQYNISRQRPVSDVKLLKVIDELTKRISAMEELWQKDKTL